MSNDSDQIGNSSDHVSSLQQLHSIHVIKFHYIFICIRNNVQQMLRIYRVVNKKTLTQNEINIKSTADQNVLLTMRILIEQMVFYQYQK